MLTTRELDRLTDGWPDDEDRFDLQVFAGAFRADRPELSGPALDRIGGRLRDELDRHARPALRARIAAPVSNVAGRIDVARYARRLVPLAVAASVLVAAGAWLGVRPWPRSRDNASQTQPAHVPARGTPVHQRPPKPDLLTPGPPARADVATP